MTSQHIKYFLLTGEPGVGKTTLTKKITTLLNAKGVTCAGFYTEEVRSNRSRQGFDIVSLDGCRGRLARETSLLEKPVKHNVGKYGVLIQEFENIALPSLKLDNAHHTLLVIDEIGKMEFFSNTFKTRIEEIFNETSQFVVLATIPLRKSDSLIEFIRNNSHSKVWTVTRENRNCIHEELVTKILEALR